ncbi:Rhotekin [Bienertia sinuspersici]
MVVQLELAQLDANGPDGHWPVILPLTREGGCRCSVKPASRSTLLFRAQELELAQLDANGPDGHWPVILPLTREGGCRCSVKPASRSTLLFRAQEVQAFAHSTWANSQLG